VPRITRCSAFVSGSAVIASSAGTVAARFGEGVAFQPAFAMSGVAGGSTRP